MEVLILDDIFLFLSFGRKFLVVDDNEGNSVFCLDENDNEVE